ncbi:MAG TPA: T9SS type A sorting domain-containing protein [Flavobacteriales bacterium]|nr:T9SS type A sorting domain-containing protein [Flavobacteriales bacterium]
MRTSVLCCISALIFLDQNAIAQLHAGEVPDGSAVIDVEVDLTLIDEFTQDSVALEVDCDDQPDIVAYLLHGAPAVDAPNSAMLRMVDDDLELCMDMAQFPRPKYYELDELLDCAGEFDWQSSAWHTLGDFGGFLATGPTTVQSKFIAYRRGEQLGWLQLSFNVGEPPAVQLQIHQVLPLCPSTLSVAAIKAAPAFTIFPNPNNGEEMHVQSAGALRSIDVIDAAGRTVAQHSGAMRTFPAPTEAGTYIVRAIGADGQRTVTQFVRY